MKKALVSGIFLLGLMAASAMAAQTDKRLADLFASLQATTDTAEARALESHIWAIWLDSGRADVNGLMDRGARAMGRSDLRDALERFEHVVELAPGFAEGWNKRATVYYLLGELDASVRDIERTLALEPRHFGAVSGMGLIHLQRGDEIGALAAFEAVLKIHPNSSGARHRVDVLRRKLHGKAI